MGTLLNIAYGLAILVSLPWILFRGLRTGRYRAGWAEKLFGWVPRNLSPQDSNRRPYGCTRSAWARSNC